MMNCSKCGREMMISHVTTEIIDGEEKTEKVYVCVNEKCSEYSSTCRIKPKERKI